MTLQEQLRDELKEAMKASDKLKVSVIRLLQSAIQYKEIDLGRELSDEEVVAVVGSGIKQRRESIKLYQEGGRNDLADKETQELELLSQYLPPQMTDDDLRQVIQRAIEETGASSPKDLGKVMKTVMSQVKGQADGSLVSQLAREFLSS